MLYDDDIENLAQEVGYKIANLEYLKRELGQDPSQDGIVTNIPAFVAIQNSLTHKHLTKYAPEWEEEWKKFTQDNPVITDKDGVKYLSETAKQRLADFQKMILECFTKNPLTVELSALKDADLIMVRSTGKEDSTDLSNPGGNESKPSKLENVSVAIAEVISSYFGEKSFTQRLNGGDDITKPPFMPVLLQTMVGEAQNIVSEKDVVVSGVMYSDNGITRIQAAPGHGELVVNSKGNCDNYYINDDRISSEIKIKPKRLKAQFDGKATELVFVNNDDVLKYESALEEDVLLHLHHLAQEVEKLYGRRMDTEFVYDPKKRTVFLVQARALIAKNLKPSSISPAMIAEFSKNHKIANGQVITPEVNRATLIEKPEQVIICKTINEALDRFVKGVTRAVLIEKEAPDTSHEAGEFNNHRIPVLQVQDISSLRKKFDETENYPFLLDPQRKSLFKLPEGFISEENLYETGVLKEGIFKSTLTAYSTPSKRPLQEQFKPTSPAFISPIIDQKSFGEMVHNAKKGDSKATKAVLNFVYQIIAKESSNKDLPENLKQLELPTWNGDNAAQKKALSQVLRGVWKIYQKESPTGRDLCRETLLSGADLFLFLDQMENGKYDQERPLIYLNNLEKFTGLIRSLPRKDVLSQSVATNLLEKKHEKEVSSFLGDLDGEKKDYFIQASKLGRLFINQDHKSQWYQFCSDVCKTKPNQLATILGSLAKQGVRDQWINITFIEAYNHYRADSENLFAHLVEIMPDTQKYSKVADIITDLESQLPSWSNPAKFPALFEGLKKATTSISEELQYSKSLSHLEQSVMLKKAYQLVDLMDKTIKAVSKSSDYSDENQQGKNSKALIGVFYTIMKDWAKYADFQKEGGEIFSKMEERFSRLSPPFTRESLSPSRNFDVNAATIDKAAFLQGFSRAFDYKCNTLEDIFTLIHQNSLISIGSLSKEYGQSLKKECPPVVQKFLQEQVLPHECRDDNDDSVEIKSEFLYANLEDQIVSINYNIPLRNHSAALAVKYNPREKDKAVTINYSCFGNNTRNRWNFAQLYAHVNLGAALDLKFVQEPYFSSEKDTFSMEVVLENEDQIKPLIKCINRLNELTFIAYGLDNTPEEKELITKLIKNYPTQNFNINDFCIENPEIFTDYRFRAIGKIVVEGLSDKIDLSYHKTGNNSNLFSILELHLNAQESMILTHDFSESDYSQHNFLLNILLEKASNNKEKSEQYLEKVKNLISKGAHLNFSDRSKIRWDNLLNSPSIFEILTYENCDEDIIYGRIYAGLFENDGESAYRAFANQLSEKLNINNETADFIDKMLSADDEKGNKHYTKIYEYLDTISLDKITKEERIALFKHADKDGNTILMRAAAKGDVAMIKYLFEQGAADFSLTGSEGLTAFSLAVKNKQESAIKEMIELGNREATVFSPNLDGSYANSNSPNFKIFKELSTILSITAEDKKSTLTRLLLLMAKESRDASPINEEIGELLIHVNEVEINAKNQDGDTALIIAARNGNKTLVSLLLDNGADPSIRNNEGITALSESVKKSQEKAVKELIERSKSDSRILGGNSDGTSAFAHIKYDNPEILNIFVKNGILPEDADKKALNEALYMDIAIGGKDEEFVKILLQIGISDCLEKNLFDAIVFLRESDCRVRVILDNGADPLVEKNGLNAFSYAAYENSDNGMRLMINLAKEYPKLLSPNLDGSTALSHASTIGGFKLLIENGFIPSERDKELLGQKLTKYIKSGNIQNIESVSGFLKAGIIPNEDDKELLGQKLTQYIKSDNIESVSHLLEAGIIPSEDDKEKLDQKLKEYIEYLHRGGLFIRQYIEKTEYLVGVGVSTNLDELNSEGVSYLSLAKRFDWGEKMTNYLLQHETKKDISNQIVPSSAVEHPASILLDSAELKENDTRLEVSETTTPQKRNLYYNNITNALTDAAYKSIRNPSPTAKKKIKNLSDEISQSIAEAYGSDIDAMKMDFKLKTLEDFTHPQVLSANQNIQDLGRKIIDTLGGEQKSNKLRLPFSSNIFQTINPDPDHIERLKDLLRSRDSIKSNLDQESGLHI